VGQDSVVPVQEVAVDTALIASPELRSLVIEKRLDRDHDQYLTLDELDTAIADAEREAIQDARRARLLANHSWLVRNGQRAPISTASPPSEDYLVPNDATTLRITSPKLRELRWARRQLTSTGSYELSLVSQEFHRRFAGVPLEQRQALLKADANGNNDGTLTVPEFYEYNRRPFFRKSRFEADFGEQAYLDVLRSLGVLPAR
jgi:hypothetical protein